MAESTRQTGQDHSKFDNMSTAELNEYLRQDSYCEDSNLDDILYVMEVLERREKEDGNYSPPDVQKAWAEFQKCTISGIPSRDEALKMIASLNQS